MDTTILAMNQTRYPLIIDGHNDTVLSLLTLDPDKRRTFFEKSESGHLDLPRAKQGGLGGGFFAVFIRPPDHRPSNAIRSTNVPGATLPPALEPAYAARFAMKGLAKLLTVEAQSDGQVRIVRTSDDLATCLDEQVLAMILHFEGAEAIDTDLDALDVFYAAGLRSLGITWSRPTAFGTGVPFAFPAGPDIGPGLTDAGRALVKACNRLGIMLDLSHLNEKGFWDVETISDAPLVATHSGAHSLCVSPRNLTDSQLDAVQATGGVVGVNFHIGFLRADGRTDAETSLTEIARHVDYMVDRMGIDHVAFGSDFDGALMPQDLKDAAGLPRLMAELEKRGYDNSALTKIAHGNWQRVLELTWR